MNFFFRPDYLAKEICQQSCIICQLPLKKNTEQKSIHFFFIHGVYKKFKKEVYRNNLLLEIFFTIF